MNCLSASSALAFFASSELPNSTILQRQFAIQIHSGLDSPATLGLASRRDQNLRKDDVSSS